MMDEQIGFNVTEEVQVGDLSDVKETRVLTPQAQNVRVRITKASTQENKDKDIRSLRLELRIVDGIPVHNQESGEAEMKYQNKPVFTGIMDLIYWADVSVKGRSAKQWWKSSQHLVGLKKFCQALDIDLKSVKVNDDFLETLLDRELLIDIGHEEETQLNQETGERVKLGTFRERIKAFKKA